VKKYGFSDWTRVVRPKFLQGTKSILKKSQRVKRKFWGQEVLFRTKFLKFGPKRANLATLSQVRASVSTRQLHASLNAIA